MSKYAVFTDIVSIKYPYKRLPVFQTKLNVAENDVINAVAGRSYPLYRYEYKISAEGQNIERFNNFFCGHLGAAVPFYIIDFEDYKTAGEIIGIGDSETVNFQIKKKYEFRYNSVSNSFYTLDIKHLVENSLKIYINDIETTDYTFDYDAATGIITFNSAPSTDAVIEADFEFYRKVRFDELQTTFETKSYQRGEGTVVMQESKLMETIIPKWLYEITIDSEILRYVRGSEKIIFNGNEYLPTNISHGNITNELELTNKNQSVTIPDLNGEWTSEILNNEASGIPIWIMLIFMEKNTESGKYEITDDDPVIDSVYYTGETSSEDNGDTTYITFQITKDYQYNKECPGRNILKNFCSWKFKGIECGYTGDAEECNNTFSKCKELGNESRFAGFPGIPGRGVKNIMITAPIIKEHAKKFIGIKYKFGSFDKTEGLDCYTFIHTFFKELDIETVKKIVSEKLFKTDLNYYLIEFKEHTKEITLKEINDGDIILFKINRYSSHSAIYTDKKILHCTRNTGVQFSDFSEFWKKKIVAIGRVIEQ